MVHLTQLRDLNIFHKRMILDNSRLNQGPVKSFRMFKEHVRGYKNVGASLEDFKIFSRDVKKFIKGYDAQMLIENFTQRKAICSSFFFDFDIDDEGRLSKIFWANPISIKNYTLFGDMLSLDTTFNMNQYRMVFAPFTGVDHHKKCVTFGAGLLANETVDSFSWLFQCFLKAMGDKYPTCIVTDQDLGIKGAVEKVFGTNTKHRYCMWHIMKKVAEKVGPMICKETNFLKELSSCVWAEDVEPNEFENKWHSIISSYGLIENEWLKNMFEIRMHWIPSYFRDLFLGGLMRTTSRSESKNNFFGNFTNPNLTLVEFWMRFDTAMDAQRWKQSKLIADSKNTLPILQTPLPLEKHASETYTPTIFFEFQEELKAACFSCGIDSVTRDDIDYFSIIDHEKNKVYTVGFDSNDDKVHCSCKRFERHGILCRHILYVLKDKGFKQVPNRYLLPRWSKFATCQPVFNAHGNLLVDCASLDNSKNKTSELWSEVLTCMTLVEKKDEYMDEFMEVLKGFKDKLGAECAAANDATSGTVLAKSKNKVQELEMLIGTTIPSEVVVLPPKQSKTKGSGKRRLSEKEKIVQEQKRQPRKCNACGEMGYHDSRNCRSKKLSPFQGSS